MPPACPTDHSSVRTFERLKISEADLFSILDRGLTVDMGVEPGTSREHRLFYSLKDREFFVAVQCHRTGEVVTVLPLDYHSGLAWVVPDPFLIQAMELAMGEDSPTRKLSALQPKVEINPSHPLEPPARAPERTIPEAAQPKPLHIEIQFTFFMHGYTIRRRSMAVNYKHVESMEEVFAREDFRMAFLQNTKKIALTIQQITIAISSSGDVFRTYSIPAVGMSFEEIKSYVASFQPFFSKK